MPEDLSRESAARVTFLEVLRRKGGWRSNLLNDVFYR